VVLLRKIKIGGEVEDRRRTAASHLATTIVARLSVTITRPRATRLAGFRFDS
jgi:hypothetical protein